MKPDEKTAPKPAGPQQTGMGLWFPLLAGLLGGIVGGFLAAHFSLSPMRDALAQRPPLVIQDMGAALVRVAPEDAAGAIVDQQRLARRLGAAGVLVLDADAVLAAPDGFYVRRASAEGDDEVDRR